MDCSENKKTTAPKNIVQTKRKTHISKAPSTACKLNNILTMQNGAQLRKKIENERASLSQNDTLVKKEQGFSESKNSDKQQ